MKVILDNTDVNSAIKCFLKEQNIIDNNVDLDIDITKTRTGDGGVTAEVTIIPVEYTVTEDYQDDQMTDKAKAQKEESKDVDLSAHDNDATEDDGDDSLFPSSE